MAEANIRESYFSLKGGLDQKTPSIEAIPGTCLDAMNYEPDTQAGYRRMDGFERYDGQASPTAAHYWYIPFSQLAPIAVGSALTGSISGATGILLLSQMGIIIVARVSGTFLLNEAVTVSGATVGNIIGAAIRDGAPQSKDHRDYALLAANDQRTFIGAVPGSGPVRGVWVYRDTVYAFRDNAGATAKLMFKATGSGWQSITMPFEVGFTGGSSAALAVGDTIYGVTSTATGVVKAILLRTGAWSGTGIGTIVYTPTTGTFQSGEVIKQTNAGGTTIATSSSVGTQVLLQPGGRYDFDNYNFTGSSDTLKMYGADGVNPAFEFDGTTYVPIHTGMTNDAPSFVRGYLGQLFLAFLGSVQQSSLGSPYGWSVVVGAGEIGLGDNVTAMIPYGGDASASVMLLATKSHIAALYGTPGSYKLVTSIGEVGFYSYTAQTVLNNVYGLTARGIQSLVTTLTFGDFDAESVSHMVQPLLDLLRGTQCASNSVRSKNNYRLYFSDGSGITVGFTGNKISGIMPFNYGKKAACICTANLSTGLEVTFFGSDDGFVYQSDIGTSFDGAPIEHWIRLHFNHLKSPRLRKRFRRAAFDMQVVSYCELKIFYDLGFGSTSISPPPIPGATSLLGGGGYWNSLVWDHFVWDNQVILDPSIALEGTEKNISFVFYGNRAQDESHTLQGINVFYSPRRLER